MPSFLSRGRQYRLCFLLAGSSSLLVGQGSPVGNITGTVLDPAGKRMVGVLVQVVTPRGTLETRTNDRGQFLFTQLVPTRVTLKVSSKGFAGFQAETVVIVNQTANLNIKLQPESHATVEVVASRPTDVTDVTVAKTGLVTTMDTVANLPLVGSSYFPLVDQVVMRAPGADAFIVHGTDEYQNAFQVDGIDTADANYGGRATKINDDFVDQVQLLTGGISAKYGQNAGTVVNITTKSGTNEFEGSLRFDVTNQKWNSRGKLSPLYALYGITMPPPEDHHSIVQSVTFTGPIIKDKLFFAGAYQTTVPMRKIALMTTSIDFGGVPYKAEMDYTIKDLKLDWEIRPSHRLSAAWNESEDYVKDAYASGYTTSLATLDGKHITKKGYWSLGYTGALESNLLLDVKYNDTTNKSGGPGTGPTGGVNVPTWQSTTPSWGGDILDNGLGSAQPISSHTRNATAGITWFLQAAGEHQIEAGFQAYEYTREGAAATTPSNFLIHFNGYVEGATTPALQNRVLAVNNPVATYLDWWQPITGKVVTKLNSLYLNDSWKVDTHWSANLGLRFDKYKSDSTPENNSYSFDSLTPRLALNYDLRGDKVHLFTATYSVYAGKILQGQLGGASVSQTPIRRSYVYLGTGGANQGLGTDALTASGGINWAAWGNAAGQTGQDNPNFVADPFTNRNVFVDPNIKAPRSREVTLGYRYEVDGQSFTANLVRRWNDRFVDDYWYGNGMGPGVAKIVITNDQDGRQDYYGLELTYRKRFAEGFSVGGNLTWARTLENAGETLNGSTSAAHNFGNSIPASQLQPYGPAPNLDNPLMINADASYVRKLGPGRFNVGLLWTYKGPSAAGFNNGYAITPDSLTAMGYDSYYYRNFPEMGVNRNPHYHWFDLQLGYEVTMAKKSKAYIKVNIKNVLNQLKPQIVYFSGDVTDSQGNPYPMDGSAASNKYVPNFMNNIPAFYQDPRNVQVTMGFKF